MGKKVHVETSIPVWRRMLTELILLSIATACISYTVTEAAVFRSFRAWIGLERKFIGKLIHCGFCFGFWVAAVMEYVFIPQLFSIWYPVGYVLTALVIAWLSAFQWAIMCCLMKYAGK